MIINRFGLHYAEGGIPFLVQGDGATNLISRDFVVPFTLQTAPRRLRCPHKIDLNVTAPAPAWLEDPLAKAFLPLPSRGPAVAVYDPDRRVARLAEQLIKLTSPVLPLIQPVWWVTPFSRRGQFIASNLGPVVVTAATNVNFDATLANLQTAQACNRQLVVIAEEKVPLLDGVEWITTELTEVDGDNLEAVGAGVLRRFMEDGN